MDPKIPLDSVENQISKDIITLRPLIIISFNVLLSLPLPLFKGLKIMQSTLLTNAFFACVQTTLTDFLSSFPH